MIKGNNNMTPYEIMVYLVGPLVGFVFILSILAVVDHIWGIEQ